jgi:hypothetical protein
MTDKPRSALSAMGDEILAATLFHDRPYTTTDLDALLALAAKYSDAVTAEMMAVIDAADDEEVEDA